MPRIPNSFGQIPQSAPISGNVPKPTLPKAPPTPKPPSIPESAKSPFLGKINIQKYSVDPGAVFRQMFGATPK